MGTGTLDSTATPRVSMVMPVHNGARWLADAIESVLAQDFGDFELILVDDASRDGSPAIMADAAAETPAPWLASSGHEGGGHGKLPKAGIELAQAAAQVGRTGTPEQVQQAVTVLEDARRRLYSILAQD